MGEGDRARVVSMNWEILPNDVWSLIGSKLDVAADRVRFRAVCKSWMSLLPFPQLIWLMIPQSQHQNQKEEEQQVVPHLRPTFVVVGEQLIYHLHLPEAHEKRCVGSTGTCLITVDLHGNICAFNPFTRVEINLPPQSTLEDRMMPQGATPEEERDSFIGKIVLSSSELSNDCIAIAIHHRRNRIAIARPGGASWTTLYTDGIDVLYLEDIIFFQDRFYGVNSHGLVMVIDLSDSLDSCEVSDFTSELLELNPEGCLKKKYYLVEWLGELVLVVRHIPYPAYDEEPAVYNTLSFQLYKVDLPNKHLFKKNWVDLNSLGEHSLFLGLNTSVSIRVSDYDYNGSLKGNCIYFTEDYSYGCCMGYQCRRIRRGLDMGVYDLKDKTIQPIYREIVFPSRASPIWVIPTPPSTMLQNKAKLMTP